ncbi:MAG: hypothetical protein MUO90_01370 [Dehalococcoidales bacterium]|nr:hypothetical protein [Dehalococcoidales bacterium]
MKYPPLIMKLRIINDKKSLRLWLPIFLLYPFLLVLALVVEILALVAFLLLWPFGWGKTLLLTIPYIFRVICNLRDLEVDVQNKQETFFVSFR